jgi:hypothetical protein
MQPEPTNKATQKTQPRPRKKGKKMPDPIEIPVPSKSQVMGDFEKIVATEDDEDE